MLWKWGLSDIWGFIILVFHYLQTCKTNIHCSVLNLQATILLNLFLHWFSCFSLCTHDLLLRWTLFKLCWWKTITLNKNTIIITCKLYDQVLTQCLLLNSSNKFDHSPPQVTVSSLKLRFCTMNQELAETKKGSPIQIDFWLSVQL